jgi:hypothetical protein
VCQPLFSCTTAIADSHTGVSSERVQSGDHLGSPAHSVKYFPTSENHHRGALFREQADKHPGLSGFSIFRQGGPHLWPG